ncbi:MAG: HD domain-containing protein [Phycisphaerales bacterium]
MSDQKVRRAIALRAAQMMYTREEREYFQAKRKAAKLVTGDKRGRDLPSNAEIREQVQLLAEMLEGDKRQKDLTRMRLEALRFLRLLNRWRPRLIGSVLTGHIRAGSDIDLHVFCDSPTLVADVLEQEGFYTQVEYKRVTKGGEERHFTHVHVKSAFDVELTVYPADKANYPFKSSITGKLIEKTDDAGLVALLRETNPGMDVDVELEVIDVAGVGLDVWMQYVALLRPLEGVKQNPVYHPEGDALFHSLQVFELAAAVRAWDEEFLLAALLHDVGKAVDPRDHVAAGLEALDGLVSERTAWLIAHHMEAHEYRAGTLGMRAKRRLSEHEDLEDLLLLSELDEAGRVRGAVVRSVEEAVEFVRGVGEG